MPSCFVPGCKSGYVAGDGRHLFKPPKNSLSEWNRVIPRSDRTLTEKDRVCDVHFSNEMLVKVDSFVIQGKVVELKRDKWKLTTDAVPHKFPGIPKYFNFQPNKRKAPKIRTNQARQPKRKKTEEPKIMPQELNVVKEDCTDSSIINKDISNEVIRLRKEVKRLRILLSESRKKKRGYLNQINKMKRLISKYKINVLNDKQKLVVRTMTKKNETCARGMRYEPEFILESLMLLIKSRKGYEHCLNHQLLPLPSLSLLRKLSRGMKCNYGINPHVLMAVANDMEGDDDNRRNCVLIFDEVKLREDIRYNSSSCTFDGFVNMGQFTKEEDKNVLGDHALVFFLVPLMKNWVQPIAIYLSKNATDGATLAKIIIQVIVELEKNNIRVVAFTCDGSQPNKKAWKELGISGKINQVNNYLINPCDSDRKIFALGDICHEIKCVRNNFHKSNNVLYNGNIIQYDYYRKLYNFDTLPGDGKRLAPHITTSHLDPKAFQKMSVKLATQLFSRSVALGIKFCREMGVVGFEDSEKTETFTNDINDLFDAMNSKLPIKGLQNGDRNHRTLKMFNEILQRNDNSFASNQTLESLRVTVKSTLDLAENLWASGYKYVLTAKLNQDPAERHFGLIRGLSSDDHPTTIDFLNLHLLQSIYVPVKGVLSSRANCEDTIDNKLASFTQQIRNMARTNVEKSRNIKADIQKQIMEKISLRDIEPELTPLDLSYDDNNTTRSADNIVYYLCGYLIHIAEKRFLKCKECLNTLQTEETGISFDIQHLNSIRDFGDTIKYLKYPSLGFYDVIKRIDKTLENKLKKEDAFWGDVFSDCVEMIYELPVFRSLCCSEDHLFVYLPQLVFHYIKCLFIFRAKEISREKKSRTSAKSTRKLAKLSSI